MYLYQYICLKCPDYCGEGQWTSGTDRQASSLNVIAPLMETAEPPGPWASPQEVVTDLQYHVKLTVYRISGRLHLSVVHIVLLDVLYGSML